MPMVDLTNREIEILNMLSEGLSNKEIAQQLSLAEKTVRWYNSQLYSKLGVQNRQAAVEQATILGLLIDEETTPTVSHNLPAPTTTFVGREKELAELRTLLNNPQIRLITILAPGGMGKTRLAQEVAQQALTAFPDGVTFVPLAALNTADHILSAISESIETFQVFAGAELEKQLTSYLRERRTLLVLDSFEHILSGASIVAELLKVAPEVKILVTSRERLNLSGEQVFTIGGMVFPDWETPADVLEYSAVKLFWQHARLARHDFEVREDNFNYLARICRLVAGMPLGLVLAAAWVEVLSLQEIADEISQGFEFLESEKRDLPERQRSIYAVFDTSWKRLSDPDQQSFMKLAVFRGGFTRQAAKAVADANLQTLQRLVSKALVSLTPVGRYEIHELLRQYAEEQLNRSGAVEATREAHSHHFLTQLADLEIDIKGRRQAEALDTIIADSANMRLAWNWAFKAKRFDWISNALESIKVFAWYRFRYQDQLDLFRHPRIILMNSGENPLLCSRLVTAEALLSSYLDTSDTGSFQWALDIARLNNDQAQIALCLWTMGLSAYRKWDYAAGIHYLHESLAHFHVLGDTFYSGWALQWLGSCARQMQGLGESTRFFQESLELRQISGDRVGEMFAKSNFGINSLLAGSFTQAEKEFWAMEQINSETGQPPGFVAAFLGWIAAMRGNILLAQKFSAEARQNANDTQFKPNVSHSLSLKAVIGCLQENYAAGLTSGLEAREIINLSYYVFFAEWAVSLACCGLEDYDAAQHSTYKALAYAYQVKGEGAMTWCLPPAAIILAQRAQYHDAAALLSLAYHHPKSVTGWMRHWPRIAHLQEDLRTSLGAAGYREAWEQGKQLDLFEIVPHWLAQNG